jgi:hypothetical protein
MLKNVCVDRYKKWPATRDTTSTSCLRSLIAFRIPWFQISSSALVVCHGLFQDRPILFACSLQQLNLQWFHRFRTFCCFACVTIFVLVRSPTARLRYGPPPRLPVSEPGHELLLLPLLLMLLPLLLRWC